MASQISPLVFLPFSILSLLLVRYTRTTWQSKDVQTLPIPSAKEASWIWGHERTLFLHNACEKYIDWMCEFGSIYRIKTAFLNQDAVVVTDNAAAQHIFNHTDRYLKAPAFRPIIVKLLGKGLVWAEGEEHRIQRKLLAPAFTPESIRVMADDILESAQKLENRLHNQLDTEKDDITINICPQVSACTLDIIGRVAFGHDFQSGQSPEAKLINESWSKDINMGITFAGFLAPFIIGMFPFIASTIGEGVTKRVVSKLAESILDREGHLNNEDGEKKIQDSRNVRSAKDILSLLVQSKRRNGGYGLSNQQIADNVATFIMVGHETSAVTLNMTLLELSRNTKSQDKLRREIALLGDGELDFDAVQKLEYLDAVLREGLRLHPAAPRTDRVAVEDDVLPLSLPVHTTDGRVVNSIHIKAGQIFQIPFTGLNVNPTIWGPDSRIFRPERWIEPGGVKSASQLPHGWGNISTFCDGPRSCIGYRLAIAELKVILATLIRSFEFHDTGAEVRTAISPTLQPVTDGKGGYLPLRLKLVQH